MNIFACYRVSEGDYDGALIIVANNLKEAVDIFTKEEERSPGAVTLIATSRKTDGLIIRMKPVSSQFEDKIYGEAVIYDDYSR